MNIVMNSVGWIVLWTVHATSIHGDLVTMSYIHLGLLLNNLKGLYKGCRQEEKWCSLCKFKIEVVAKVKGSLILYKNPIDCNLLILSELRNI